MQSVISFTLLIDNSPKYSAISIFYILLRLHNFFLTQNLTNAPVVPVWTVELVVTALITSLALVLLHILDTGAKVMCCFRY